VTACGRQSAHTLTFDCPGLAGSAVAIALEPVAWAPVVGSALANRGEPMPFEVVCGRWLAVCAHPICAWRRYGTPARLLVVTSYFAAGYVGVLAALLAL